MSTALTSGSSGSGALTQLMAKGTLNEYLTDKENGFTYFAARHKKHKDFAMESFTQQFNTQVAFGGESQIQLNRTGDLITYMYVVIDLPGITAVENDGSRSNIAMANQFPACANACRPCKANDDRIMEEYLEDGYTDADPAEQEVMMRTAKNKWMRDHYGQGASLDMCEDIVDCPTDVGELPVFCHWVNDIGHFIIRNARVVIGGAHVDILYNDLMFAWEELSGRPGRKLSEMTLKRYSRTQLVCDSRQKRTLYVPLPFWFTTDPGQALALASLQFHGVQLQIQWESLQRCIVVSNPNVSVINCSTGSPINQNDLNAAIETTYIYVEEDERVRFATQDYETLIVQHQAYSMQATNSSVSFQLNFNHPVIELIWMLRRKCQEMCNNHFNYSGVDNRDPVELASLLLNNQPRVAARPGIWFRTVVPRQFHTNIPDAYIYVYSFALYPEDTMVPSGTVNMSRIDHVEMRLKLQEGLDKEQVSVIVFARNYNVLKFSSGLAGLLYAS